MGSCPLPQIRIANRTWALLEDREEQFSASPKKEWARIPLGGTPILMRASEGAKIVIVHLLVFVVMYIGIDTTRYSICARMIEPKGSSYTLFI